MKTDQEPAITDPFRAVAKERGESRTVLETAPRGDSKGDGQAKKVVQSIEEMVRIPMICPEIRCGENISVTEDVSPWLLEHACDLLNRFKVRKLNRTEWEFLKGKPYSG